MNGILLIDKPAGLSSHAVVSKLRKKLHTKKIGHAGTLDPSATGLLILCIGYATKISGYVMDGNKIYRTRCTFGKTTSTYDTEGEVTSQIEASHITENQIQNALPSFCGEILQKPPIYSAIKINGRKLYQYARSNTEIEIPDRQVTIHALELISFENPFAVLEMKCSKGTYVRSLVHDLGQKLGVGASVETIHRIESSPFSIQQAVALDTLLEMDSDQIQAKMISVADALQNHFNPIQVSDREEELIRQGVEFPKNQIPKPIFTPDALFLFVSKNTGKEIAIAQWGLKETISYLRIL